MSDPDSRRGDDGGVRAMPDAGDRHVPVLLGRVTDLLLPALTRGAADGAGAVMVDGTLGLGGHTEHLLRELPGLRVVGIDRDTEALRLARERLAGFGDRFIGVHARYDEIAEVLAEGTGAGFEIARGRGVDGVLLDLGVSSMQLDEADRGFAYAVDAPLDMRMDQTRGITAAEVLNTYSHGDLARILSSYGEERFAGKIASAILREREREPFTSSGRLVELLYATIPAATRRTGGHPAKRTFQALRVEVNAELDSLRRAVPAAVDALAAGGRAVFMAYQSLEDRIVKQELVGRTRSVTPIDLPVDLPGTEPTHRLVTRGAERASEAEIEDNPRAAPVRVRCIERIVNVRRPS